MMTQRIIYDDGGILAIVTPATNSGLTIEEIAVKDVPAGVPFSVVDVSAIPQDRTFRNAWRKSGNAVSVDMPAAREIHRERMRVARAPLLQDLDVEYIRAIERNDQAQAQQIAGQKQRLRDVTNDPAIEVAATPEALKAVWPTILGNPQNGS